MKKIFVLMIVAAVAFCTGCNNKKIGRAHV